MRMLAGLLKADDGTARVIGFDPIADDSALHAVLGYMPQKFGLYEDLTVQQNLDLYADLHGIDAAARAGIWVALGSLAVAREDGHWANRSFVIDSSGQIAARYDKIHMFDVDLECLALRAEGHGVALARSMMAHDDIASGRLVRLVSRGVAVPGRSLEFLPGLTH